MSEEVKLNLYQKMSKVMQDVRYLTKDGKIEFNKTKYKAITEEKVTASIRASLIEHGLVILPVEQEHSKEGNLSTVNTRYKIVDIDSGESEFLVSSGTGADTQDKGVGKAMTYSYKYLLLRTFAIPTGEDPDQVSSAELDEKMKKEKEEEEKLDELNNEITKKFSEALKSVGGNKADLYKEIQKTQNDMSSLYKSNDNKAKQGIIEQLEGVIHDYANAG